MMRLVLVTMPRAGSNWTQDIIGNAPNVLTCREVLGPRWRQMIEKSDDATALWQSMGAPDPGDDPVAILSLWEGVARAKGHCGLSFTLFPHHARGARATAILSRPNTYAVHLLRRQLPRYVSYRKAQDTQIWKRAPTDHLRPTVSVEDFIKEAARVAKWHQRALCIKGPHHRFLRYEDDLDGSVGQALESVRTAIPWLDLPSQPEVLKSSFTRQHSRGPIAGRFENGTAFCAALEQRGYGAVGEAYPDASIWSGA